MRNCKIKIEIICEIASSHGGNIEDLLDLILVANNAGSDWLKIQIFKYENLVAEDNKKFADLKIIEINQEDWKTVLDFVIKLNIKLIIEPFDYESFLKFKGHPAIKGFKIPTSDLLDEKFVRGVFSEQKTVFIAVGGTKLTELDNLMVIAREYPSTKVVLLHGFQNFPTKLEDSLLSKIPEYINRYNCVVGFADHIDAAEEELARTLPAMAIASGARVIEKHVTMDRSKKGYDYYSALNPDEFIKFVNYIENISKAIGSGDLNKLSSAELDYRNNMKKFAVAAEDIVEGSLVGEANIVYRRTLEPGLTHADIKNNASMSFKSSLLMKKVISLDDINK